MESIVICLAAFLTAILTFFSGFGLGTILMLVFAIFFPLDIAIALTGIVHFSNNLFKISLIGGSADKEVLLRFGVPAIIASFAETFIGNKLLKKITFRSIQVLVAMMLFLISISLAAGTI
jgi:uncharacterized protein